MAIPLEWKWRFLYITGFLVFGSVLAFHTVFDESAHTGVPPDVSIRIPPGYYNFNNQKNDLQGWTIDGIYEGNTDKSIGSAFLYWNGNNDVANTPGQDPVSDTSGSIHFFLSQSFLGSRHTQSGADRWRIEFVSPHLANEPNWQNIKGIFAAVTYDGYYGGAAPQTRLTLQFVVSVRRGDGSTYQLEEEPVAGAYAPYHEIDPNQYFLWQQVRGRFVALAPGDMVIGIRVKVFGSRISNAYPFSRFTLDAVSQIR